MVCQRHSCSLFYHLGEGEGESGLVAPVLGTQAPTCVSSIPTQPVAQAPYSPPAIMTAFQTKARKQGQRRTWHIPLRTFPGRCIHCCHLYSVGENKASGDPSDCSLHSAWLAAWLTWALGHPERTKKSDGEQLVTPMSWRKASLSFFSCVVCVG